MGNFVHVIKKHEEYGNTEAFNWNAEKFHDLLCCLNCDVAVEEEYEGSYARFECPVEDYKRAIKLLRAFIKHGNGKKTIKMFDEANADLEELNSYLDGLGTAEYVLANMRSFYDERDKKSSWISFASW